MPVTVISFFFLLSWAQDNAENLTVQSLAYMIDKTLPQLWEMNFWENSPYISIEDRDQKKYMAKISSAISQYFGFNEFPSLDDYVDIPKISQKEITAMKTIRFKKNDVRSDNLTITLPNLTDSWNKLVSGNVSGLQKVELLMQGNTSPLTTFGNISEWENTFTIKPRDLFPMAANTGKYMTLRAYDTAGNTSDHVFYAFRDETVPLVKKPNGEYEIDFRFQWHDYNIVTQWSGLSNFALATNTSAINYSWGPANNHMANVIMKVEKDKDSSAKNSYNLNPINTTNHNTSNIAITDVDGDLFNPNSGKNFRVYSVEFETPGISGNKICDSVGNCISWNDVLSQIRTIAGDISEETSTLQVKTPTKAFADNDSKYSFLLDLKDKYGNKIREVKNDSEVVKTNVYNIAFTNWLTKQLVNKFTDSKISNPVTISVENNELSANQINTADSKVNFKENPVSSDGMMKFSLSSLVPTYNAYAFLMTDTIFKFDQFNWSLTYDDSITYDFDLKQAKSQSTSQMTFWTNPSILINGDLDEKVTSKYNMFIPAEYGKITNNFWNSHSDWYEASFFKDIKDNLNLQLEFAAPVIYHAQNFNILRDGINSNHKKIVTDNTNNIYNIQYRDKYFDLEKQDGISDKVDFYVNGWKRNELSTDQQFSASNYDVKYEAKEGQNFSKWWYVSYLTYNIGSNKIVLPAISRWIKPNVGTRLQSSAYFPNNISEDEDAGTSFLTDDVAIDGLVNNIDGWATSDVDTQLGLVSLDLERPYTRAGLLENVKKKIFEINRQDRWCTTDSIDVNYENDDCTYVVEWETITFIKGDVEITGWNVNKKRSIIVADGSIEVTWNISTKDSNGQVFLASISNDGLENISTLGWDITGKKWWFSIDQNVTNIDAFILAQWPLVSTNQKAIITNYDREDQLLNQLHIYGSVFSLNTIGWSKTGDCPYIYWNCDALSNDAKVFDLSFLRRFTLVDGNNYDSPNQIIPYNPTSWFVKTSGWCIAFSTSEFDQVNQSTAVWCDTNLRTPTKQDHWKAPVIIQRDQSWSMNPTYFSKED